PVSHPLVYLSRRPSHFPCFLSHPPPTPKTYTLSLHDALPIYSELRIIGKVRPEIELVAVVGARRIGGRRDGDALRGLRERLEDRSEEHTSELQSHLNLVCRLLLEKKKTQQ